jgi:hypothetical protein
MDNTQTPRLGRNLDDLVARAPVPPQDVLARRVTAADVRAYPVYFIHGPGRNIAQNTLCAHGYTLVDSFPGCDADDPP